jgi:hypothetical protein
MKIPSPLRTAFLPVALALASLLPAYAADVNGRIKGTITDPTGAVVPSVPVTATNQATGVKYRTVSQPDGGYIFQQLPVGTYTVTAQAPGFKAFSATGIVLTIDQEYVEPIKFAAGSTSETVEVEADAVQVDTSDMQLSNVVNSNQMEELPLIGRNFTGLELIEPGVQESSDRFGSYSVSGAQTQQSEFLINGADTNDIALNTLAIAPNLDAIDQFNLIEGPLNAEYDRNSGGIVSATIKQGTNHFHGDVYEFYRDSFLNTAGYFSTVLNSDGTFTKPITPYHQNIYGGTIGGPILKDKLFFFGAYEGYKQNVPESGSGNYSDQVFSAAQRGGDFSSDLGNFSTNPIPSSITIPGCTAGETWTNCLTPLGGILPTTDFNAIAAKLLSTYVPLPNAGSVNYSGIENTATTSNQYIGRFDYALNTLNHFTFLGIYDKQKSTETLPFTGATVPGFGDEDNETIQQYTFDYSRQLGATAINDFAVHWTRFNYQAVIPQNILTPASLGFSISPQNAAAASVPTMNVTFPTGNGFELGFSTNGPQPRIDQVYQIDDSVSKTLGAHQLKFGYDGRRFNVSNPFSARNSGFFGFNTQNNPYSTGDGGLDFLLGIPASYSQGTGADIQADAFLNYLYAQDSWKFTNSLTLNYGLGYSIDTPLHNNQYGGEGIACLIAGEQSKIFPTAPTGIVYPGDPGCNNAGQSTTRYTELGPRIGFAWAPDLSNFSGLRHLTGDPGKFSIRGGFGIYYDRTEEETALQTLETPPFGLSSYGAGDFGGYPQFANPFADINGGGSEPNKFPFVYPTKGQSISYATLEPLGISTYGPSFRSPYAENFQLSVERELPAKIVTRISYVGSLSRRNQITYEGNPETAAGHAACLAGNELSPVTGKTINCAANGALQSYYFPNNTQYGEVDPNTGNPAFTSVGTVGSESSSSYNALQVYVEKALSHGLQFTLSYTYAHALDNGSNFENSGFGENGARGYNQFDQALNYGDSAYDARHHFVFAPIYVTPRLDGAWYTPKNIALSGWQISGILTLATGFPYDISYAGGSSNSLYCSNDYSFYACPDVPVQTAALTRINPRSAEGANDGYAPWFAPTSFTSEPLGTFGNIHRDPYHGPGFNNTNIILAKNFPLGADSVRRLQIRMESDNVFNHTQFENPLSTFNDSIPSNYSTTTLGLINQAQSARQTQLSAKIYF